MKKTGRCAVLFYPSRCSIQKKGEEKDMREKYSIKVLIWWNV